MINKCKPRAFAKDDVFINPNKAYRFDYVWGFIQRYSSYMDENLKKIDTLISIFPEEESFLKTLSNRAKYFNVLKEELEYLSQRYDWKKIEGIYNVYIHLFEHCICQITEWSMYVLQFYIRNRKNYNGIEMKKFEDIGTFIIDKNNGLPPHYRETINHSALLSILLFIRNSLVHDYRNLVYKQNNQNPIIESNNIPQKRDMAF